MLSKLNCYNHNNVLFKKKNICALQRLHEKWVFIPTDKAANNITVVCRKYYMTILDKEIIESGNFIEVYNNSDNIIDNQVKFLNKFIVNTNSKIPFLYWTAKLHKVPISHRFITSGRGCSIQPLSINIGYCLKAILKIICNNSKYFLKKHGINKCFVVDNRDPVTAFMKVSNQINNVHTVSTFDFKTLYTSIPHNKLKRMISNVVQSAFSTRSNKNYISVSGNKAYLANDKSKSGFSVSVNELLECLNFIIDQSFIIYKGKPYRQLVGIPMGTNCAPYLANLFLYAYEEAFVSKMVGENIVVAQELVSVFRYQDDCIVFNDNGTFHSKCREIYPVEMQLDKTNNGNSCTFLDLTINIENGKFTYKCYDKRLNFNFEVINYPELQSNIPRNPSYGVFTSQLIRFCDVNDKFDNFVSDIKNLVSKLVKQNFDIEILKSKFRKFCGKELKRWSKFGSDIYNII